MPPKAEGCYVGKRIACNALRERGSFPPKAEVYYVGKHLACNALRGRRSETKGGAADKHKFFPRLFHDPMLPP